MNFKAYGQLVAAQRAIATRTDADVVMTMLDEVLEECERGGIWCDRAVLARGRGACRRGCANRRM